MSHSVALTVNISSTPPTGADFPSATVTAALAKSRTWNESQAFTRSLSGAVNVDIYPAGWTRVEMLYVKVSGGTVTLKVTSAAGSAQIVPVDTAVILWTSTQPITALTVSGTAEIEVFVAGE